MRDHQMSEEGIISPTYYGSSVRVQKGDRLSLDDNWCGRVEEICLPGSELAEAYSCFETGGLLILFDHGVLLLQPFGSYGYIQKLA